MNMRSKSYRWLALIAALILLAAWQSSRLAATRRAGMPEAYAGYSADVPPALNFVMAGLGGFRGIVSEILWFRVNRLQEENRFLELVQLAEWIAMLDPHTAEVWAYNAWNLAYNVSIMMVRDEDRLRWVQNGIRLLRDDGLRFNPREAKLYRELAWIYQNKIGDSLDSAHLAYKLDLARSMTPFLNADGTLNPSAEHRAKLAALRLDADRMLALERRFGPLDWRLAESHAIYWASQGLEYAVGTERLMCRRGVYQPLVLSVFNGRFTGNLKTGEWRVAGNPALTLAAADFLEETGREFPSRTMTDILVRFLATAVQHTRRAGQEQLAQELYRRLTDNLPAPVQMPSLDEVLQGWKPKLEQD